MTFKAQNVTCIENRVVKSVFARKIAKIDTFEFYVLFCFSRKNKSLVFYASQKYNEDKSRNEFGKGLMCDTFGARGKGRLEFLESLEGGWVRVPVWGKG